MVLSHGAVNLGVRCGFSMLGPSKGSPGGSEVFPREISPGVFAPRRSPAVMHRGGVFPKGQNDWSPGGGHQGRLPKGVPQGVSPGGGLPAWLPRVDPAGGYPALVLPCIPRWCPAWCLSPSRVPLVDSPGESRVLYPWEFPLLVSREGPSAAFHRWGVSGALPKCAPRMVPEWGSPGVSTGVPPGAVRYGGSRKFCPRMYPLVAVPRMGSSGGGLPVGVPLRSFPRLLPRGSPDGFPPWGPQGDSSNCCRPKGSAVGIPHWVSPAGVPRVGSSKVPRGGSARVFPQGVLRSCP
jgi:hypothetical protein